MDNRIGHGTWYDKVAFEIVKREYKLGRNMNVLRVESGVAASGIPHIGSFSEVTRNYAVSLALQEQMCNSEFIVFSDNKDGLRNVPKGLPGYLQEFIGFPVNKVPDPYDCHNSFGEHMIVLLIDVLDYSGIKYTLIKGTEAYETGLLKNEIRTLLKNAEYIGRIVKEETGQEKYLDALPYFPVCESCGRIYTTTANRFFPEENKVLYTCKGLEIKHKWLKGCGYKGEVDLTKGQGKLSWKAGELAARWRSLGIRFEAYGKDIADSIRVNDRISREILGYEPPIHVQYEMFLDKGGRKISKSVGNVFTPQIWFKYGSIPSLVLLTLKRFVGTRNVSVVDIPRYMDELDELENAYFEKNRILDRNENKKLTGLFKYVWFMNTPLEPSLHVPYNLLVGLAKVSPEGSEARFIFEKLQNYGIVKEEISPDLKKRVEYALKWARDFKDTIETSIILSSAEQAAIQDLIKVLRKTNDMNEIQSMIFEIARVKELTPKRFFILLYNIILGVSQGPKLGPYLIDMGKENAIKLLENNIVAQNELRQYTRIKE